MRRHPQKRQSNGHATLVFADKLEITAERVAEELAKIAFADVPLDSIKAADKLVALDKLGDIEETGQSSTWGRSIALPSQLHVDRVEVHDDAGVLVLVLVDEQPKCLPSRSSAMICVRGAHARRRWSRRRGT
jgi:hypothetical protein